MCYQVCCLHCVSLTFVFPSVLFIVCSAELPVLSGQMCCFHCVPLTCVLSGVLFMVCSTDLCVVRCAVYGVFH